MNQLIARRRLHYGWIVVAVAGAAVLIGAGVRSAPGIFLIAMEEDIGISRSAVSLPVPPLAGGPIAALGDRGGCARHGGR